MPSGREMKKLESYSPELIDSKCKEMIFGTMMLYARHPSFFSLKQKRKYRIVSRGTQQEYISVSRPINVTKPPVPFLDYASLEVEIHFIA
jgi:hypothetical protein